MSKRARVVWLGLGGILGLVWVGPVLWAVLTSLKQELQTLETGLLPWPVTLEHYQYILTHSWLPRWYANSAVTATAITVLGVAIAALYAYGLSQLEFRGKTLLIGALLATLIVPGESLLVPLFLLVDRLGLLNTYAGIVLPQLVHPLVVLVLKEFFDQVPRELRESALIDGASEFMILRSLYLPLSSSVLVSLAIVTFIGAWNNFFWPLIAVSKTSMFTIPVGLTQVHETYGVKYARNMASAVAGAVPLAVIYLLLQRQIVRAIAATVGVKQ